MPIDPQAFLQQAKQKGFTDQQVAQFLQSKGVQPQVPQTTQPQPLVTGQENILTKLGTFLGLKPLGEALGRGLFQFTPEAKSLSEMEKAGITTKEKVLGKAPTLGQVGGSVLSLGSLLAGGPIIGAGKSALSRTLLSGIPSAASGAGIALAEGKNQKEVLTRAFASGVLGMGITGGLELAGKAVKFATRALPERLMKTIFNTAEDDLRLEYQSLAKGGKPNPTLAREVLEEGLKGDSRNMAIYSFRKLSDLENQVQQTVKNTAELVPIQNKSSYTSFLKLVRGQFDEGFFPERAQTANQLLREMTETPGKKITMETALKLRRFIDNMRNTSSFRLDPNLSPRQEEFKFAADSLRRKLAERGLGEIMNKERIFIEAIDAIVSDAAKRGNRRVIGLVDVLAGGGGLVSGSLTGGVGAAVAIRGIQEPAVITRVAQALHQTGERMPKLSPQTVNLLRALQILGTGKASQAISNE